MFHEELKLQSQLGLLRTKNTIVIIQSCCISVFTVLSRERDFHSGLQPGLAVGLSTPTDDSHHVWTGIDARRMRNRKEVIV